MVIEVLLIILVLYSDYLYHSQKDRFQIGRYFPLILYQTFVPSFSSSVWDSDSPSAVCL